MTKTLFILFLTIFYLSYCKNQQNTINEKFVGDTILSLKEVKEKNKLIDSISNHKHGIALQIDKPTDTEKNYCITAGYNGDERFETYFCFYFNPETKKISIEDVAQGKRISLEEWRAPNHDSLYVNLGMNLLKNDCIGEFKIDQTATKILNSLGKPDSTDKAFKWDTDGLIHQDYYFTRKGIELNICNEKGKEPVIYRITIQNPCKYKTARNIGIGSSKQEVLNAYKKEINRLASDDKNLIAGTVFGGIFFEIENEKVKSIFMGAAAE